LIRQLVLLSLATGASILFLTTGTVVAQYDPEHTNTPVADSRKTIWGTYPPMAWPKWDHNCDYAEGHSDWAKEVPLCLKAITSWKAALTKLKTTKHIPGVELNLYYAEAETYLEVAEGDEGLGHSALARMAATQAAVHIYREAMTPLFVKVKHHHKLTDREGNIAYLFMGMVEQANHMFGINANPEIKVK
jgi:hypothetical protein